MATQIILKNVQSSLGIITIKAAIKTVDDLFDLVKECHLNYGVSLRFLKEFVFSYFPQLVQRFLSHFFDELKNTLIGWLGNLLKHFK
ncbi:hypothetical protein [Acinetobacter pittii]|uniref:hypothetical protein n=1 Tax=Acinetobacter pittii TaxID=48296 RepID=UPI00132FEF42|nr:hypothetical protein [Acinetobacter pittii]